MRWHRSGCKSINRLHAIFHASSICIEWHEKWNVFFFFLAAFFLSLRDVCYINCRKIKMFLHLVAKRPSGVIICWAFSAFWCLLFFFSLSKQKPSIYQLRNKPLRSQLVVKHHWEWVFLSFFLLWKKHLMWPIDISVFHLSERKYDFLIHSMDSIHTYGWG